METGHPNACNGMPPADYEGLITLIHDRYEQMSRNYQAIAVYLTQNPNDIPVRSVSAIAETIGVHASSLVRFAQSLGYSGFKEIQILYQKRLETAAPGFSARVRALREGMRHRDNFSETGFLRELVVQDIASLEGLLDDIPAEDLAHAVQLMKDAETIYLVGQNRSAPVVTLVRYLLTMIGKRCVLLDSSGGLATHIARTMTPDDLLFSVSFRYYATEVVSIVDEAHEAGIPVVAISDTTLSPLANSATVIFPVPEHRQSVARSLAAPICLAQALVVATAAQLQKNEKDPRIPWVTEASNR
ncbi:MurR/RpiR family transcriptional regulator [Spiribacter onubensis]|uniref:MurR/RpiR family transcriptional regulator n=1 Tax=Spiribacter onubensis TaxID=3122420 RepID=A0ABV3SB48_9GAMM